MPRHPELKIYMGDHHGPRGDMYRADEVDALLSTLRAERGKTRDEAEKAYREGFLDGHNAAMQAPQQPFEKMREYCWRESLTKKINAPRGPEGEG